MAHFEVPPGVCLVDDPLQLKLTDAPAGESVTICATHLDDHGNNWRSEAVFRTDASGCVDLATASPVQGPWTGSDPRGLLWSMDVTKPPRRLYTDSLMGSLRPFELEVVASLRGKDLAEAAVPRVYKAPDVQMEPWREDGLVANLFLPPGEGPHDVVVVLNGSTGGFYWSNEIAALIASRGRAALAVAYFDWAGSFGLPREVRELPLEYFGRAFQRLEQDPMLDTRDLALVGISTGGTLALLLGSHYPRIRKIVAYVPGLYVWDQLSADVSPTRTSSYSWRGKPFPFVCLNPDPDFFETLDRRRLGDFAARALADPDAVRHARVPVQNIEADLLLISLTEDYVWPSRWMSDEIVTTLRAVGKGERVSHLALTGTGHPLFVPGVPANGVDMDAASAASLDWQGWSAALLHLGVKPPR